MRNMNNASTEDYLVALLDNLERKKTAMKNEISGLESVCISIKTFLEENKGIGFDSLPLTEGLKNILVSKLIDSALKTDILTRTNMTEYFSDFPVNYEAETDKLLNAAYGIDGEIIDGIMILCMPILLSKTYKNVKTPKQKKVWDYSRMFSDQMHKLVADLSSGTEKFNLDSFDKTICFLYVYGTYQPFIIDTDSHDTKNVIDSVTFPFLGGDSGTTTSIYEATITTNKIEEGTYVVVIPESNSFELSKENLIKFVVEWKKDRPKLGSVLDELDAKNRE